MAISTGQIAPGFTLYDTEKKQITLEGFEGKNVVLLFFPFAFSSVCTAELCSIRDNIGIYNDANAQVLGISVDSPYVLKKYKEEQHLNFPLLSDFNKSVSRSYDALYETFPAYGLQGVSKRAAFVIDKTGTVQYAEECASPGDQPDFDAIKAVLGGSR
jgi:peroxiredoxin